MALVVWANLDGGVVIELDVVSNAITGIRVTNPTGRPVQVRATRGAISRTRTFQPGVTERQGLDVSVDNANGLTVEAQTT